MPSEIEGRDPYKREVYTLDGKLGYFTAVYDIEGDFIFGVPGVLDADLVAPIAMQMLSLQDRIYKRGVQGGKEELRIELRDLIGIS